MKRARLFTGILCLLSTTIAIEACAQPQTSLPPTRLSEQVEQPSSLATTLPPVDFSTAEAATASAIALAKPPTPNQPSPRSPRHPRSSTSPSRPQMPGSDRSGERIPRRSITTRSSNRGNPPAAPSRSAPPAAAHCLAPRSSRSTAHTTRSFRERGRETRALATRR